MISGSASRCILLQCTDTYQRIIYSPVDRALRHQAAVCNTTAAARAYAARCQGRYDRRPIAKLSADLCQLPRIGAGAVREAVTKRCTPKQSLTTVTCSYAVPLLLPSRRKLSSATSACAWEPPFVSSARKPPAVRSRSAVMCPI